MTATLLCSDVSRYNEQNTNAEWCRKISSIMDTLLVSASSLVSSHELLTLSTFAKVDLLNHCQALRVMGYGVALTRIRPHPADVVRKKRPQEGRLNCCQFRGPKHNRQHPNEFQGAHFLILRSPTAHLSRGWTRLRCTFSCHDQNQTVYYSMASDTSSWAKV